MSRKSFIDSVVVKEPCGEDWEKMTGNDRVRFCDHCAKHVENISTLRRKEATRLVRASNGDLCIRYIADPVTRRPMFADQFIQIARRTPGVAAGVMTAALSLSIPTAAQTYVASSANEVAVERQSDDVELNTDEKDASPSGVIHGTIRDFNGEPLAGVQVVLENADLQYENDEVETDKNGDYRFEDLEPKVYMLRVVDHVGMWKKAAPGLTLSAGQTIVQDLNVKVVHPPVADGTGSGSGSGSGFGFGGAMGMIEYSLPLSRAVADNDLTAVTRLLDGGAKVDGRDANYDNITPLFIAVENGNVAIAKLLLQQGAAVNAADKTGRTPLMTIDGDATPELIDLLLSYGARVNVSDDDGATPLLAAVGSGHAEIVDSLIKAGADVDLADKEDITPLMKAIREADIDVIRTLIVAGADVNARDKDGATAWDKTSDPEIEKLLVESGAIIDYDVTVEVDDTATAGQ